MNIETCRHEFITLLQLQTVLQGNDVDVWQRVHVTVSVQGSTSCEGITTRISLTPVNNDGVEMTLSDNRLTELGCDLDITSAQGECHVEIPTALASSHFNDHRWIGLKASAQCDLTTLEAWISPFTTLFQCQDDNDFWSQTLGECVSCAVELNTEFTCNPGEYMKGCDVLMHMSGASLCTECDNAVQYDALVHEWGANCELKCRDNFYMAGDGTCQACTTDLQSTCATITGHQWQACTTNSNEGACTTNSNVSCGEIKKGIFSQYEMYINDTERACQTTCKSNAYRELKPPFYCRPCTELSELENELSFIQAPDTYYRFQSCTKFSNARSEQCVEVCASNQYGDPENGISCQTCTHCNASQYIHQNCSSKTDTECHECTICSPQEYKTARCTSHSNRECAPCDICPAGETEAVA